MTEYLESLAKIPLYAGLLLLVGGSVGCWLVVPASATPDSFTQRISRWSFGFSVLIALFLLVRLLAHTAAIFESESVGFDQLELVALKSRWGASWRSQLAAAFVAVIATGAVAHLRSSMRLRRAATMVGVVVLASTYPLLGHAAGNLPREVITTVHLLGGGVWLGTLSVLVLTGRNGSLWTRFSTVAMLGAATVTLSGLLLASSYLTSWRDLVDTVYGRTFSLKMGLFLLILACGGLNWRRARLNAPPPVAALEMLLAALLVVATAFLTEMAHP